MKWLQEITECGARVMWDGRLHNFFVKGLMTFGVPNGTAKKTAKDIMAAISYNKISIVDERHRIKHKPSTKEAQAEEIRDLWTKIDEEEVEKEGAENGKAERMSRDELQKHIQGKSQRQTKEWIEQLKKNQRRAKTSSVRRRRQEATQEACGEGEAAGSKAKQKLTKQRRIKQELQVKERESDEEKTEDSE